MADGFELTKEFPHPIDRVWAAIGDAAAWTKWSGVEFHDPFVIGNTARGTLYYPGYEGLSWNIDVIAIDPPSGFTFSWHPAALDPNQDYAQEPQTRIEIRLAESAGGTQVRVSESGFDRLPPGRAAEALAAQKEGWDMQLGSVAAYLAG